MSLVPYAPYAASGAKRAYQWVSDNQDELRAAANTIGNAWKAKSRRKRPRKFKRPTRSYGETPGTAGPKTYGVGAPFASKDTRTLYNSNLLTMIRGTDNNINNRLRDIVNIRGMKMCVEMENLTSRSLWVHTALICGKNRNASFSSGDFFRSEGLNDRRSNDFDISLDSMQMRCNPINTDEWHVISHKRQFLPGTSANDKSGSTNIAVDTYHKIERQFRFEGIGAGTCNTPIWFVYWADGIGVVNGAGPSLNAYNLGFRNVTYFREPKTIY